MVFGMNINGLVLIFDVVYFMCTRRTQSKGRQVYYSTANTIWNELFKMNGNRRTALSLMDIEQRTLNREIIFSNWKPRWVLNTLNVSEIIELAENGFGLTAPSGWPLILDIQLLRVKVGLLQGLLDTIHRIWPRKNIKTTYRKGNALPAGIQKYDIQVQYETIALFCLLCWQSQRL